MKYKVIIIYSKRITAYKYSHNDYTIAETNTLKNAINIIKNDRQYLTVKKATNKLQQVGETTARYIVLDNFLNIKYNTSHILLK